MKLIKITHYENNDPEEVSKSVWDEGTEEKIRKSAERLVNYILPVYEGLKLIAEGFEDGKPVKVFANGIANTAYWVKVTIK